MLVFAIACSMTIFFDNFHPALAALVEYLAHIFTGMDGLCLISIAVIKYFLIFRQTVFEQYDEKKIIQVSRVTILILSVLIVAIDFTFTKSLDYQPFYKYLMGKNLSDEYKVSYSTRIVYSTVAFSHLLLLIRIEADNYKYEDGILYLIVKDRSSTSFEMSKFFNNIFFFMILGCVSIMITFTLFHDSLLDLISLVFQGKNIGYVKTSILVQFSLVDVVLIVLLIKK